MLEANGISGGVLQSLGDAMAEEGKTPLFFARGKELMGVIAVADVVKPTSVRQSRNCRVWELKW